VEAHRYISTTERACRNHHNFDNNNCRSLNTGVHVHPCACLLDEIKCYARKDCIYSVFDEDSMAADCLMLDPRVFTDNCALFSNTMGISHADQQAMAWFFCFLVLSFVVVYFTIIVRNRDQSRMMGDTCIAGFAFLFTILICSVWIDNTASLSFILIYVFVAIVLFFGCFYGVTADNDRNPVDGSDELPVSDAAALT